MLSDEDGALPDASSPLHPSASTVLPPLEDSSKVSQLRNNQSTVFQKLMNRALPFLIKHHMYDSHRDPALVAPIQMLTFQSAG